MRLIFLPPLFVSWALLLGCAKKPQAKELKIPPTEVTFVPALEETVTITQELPGRIAAFRVAEIRARVAGILLNKTFEEGSDVQAGDVLFRIDPAPLRAALDSKRADSLRAEANAKQAENQLNRFRELVDVNAISKQDADNSESAVAIATAELLAAKAALEISRLNLEYATVVAPISGRIGKAAITEGALVGQTDATLMATIQQLDPIYFDFTQSSSELLTLKKERSDHLEAILLLENGTEYSAPGRLLFSEAFVDQTTGMVSLRAEFPNPKHELLPGMFARTRIVQSVKKNVITVPQRAVTRAAGGQGSVLVVDEANHSQLRIIETSEATEDKWIVTSGLKVNERVIVEGHLKALHGALVSPKPYIQGGSISQ